MPTKQCQGEKDDGKDKDDNFSVATISMSIATDFDSASIKSGDPKAALKSYKRTVILNATSKPVITLHAMENPTKNTTQATSSLLSQDVLAKLIDVCAADFSVEDHELQTRLLDKLHTLTDNVIEVEPRSEEMRSYYANLLAAPDRHDLSSQASSMQNSVPMKYAVQSGQDVQVMGGTTPSTASDKDSTAKTPSSGKTYVNSDGTVSSTQKSKIKTEKNIYTLEQTITLRRDDSSNEPKVTTNTEISVVPPAELGEGESASGALLQNILAGLHENNNQQNQNAGLDPGQNDQDPSIKASSVDSGIDPSGKTSSISSQPDTGPPRVSSSTLRDHRDGSRTSTRSGVVGSAGTRSNRGGRRISFDSSSFRGSAKNVSSRRSDDSNSKEDTSKHIRSVVSQELVISREGKRQGNDISASGSEANKGTSKSVPTKSEATKTEKLQNASPAIEINAHDPSDETSSKKKKQKSVPSSGNKSPKSGKRSRSPESKDTSVSQKSSNKVKSAGTGSRGNSPVRSDKQSSKTKSKSSRESSKPETLLSAKHPLPAHLQKLEPIRGKRDSKSLNVFSETSTETRRTPMPSYTEKRTTKANSETEPETLLSAKHPLPAHLQKLEPLREKKDPKSLHVFSETSTETRRTPLPGSTEKRTTKANSENLAPGKKSRDGVTSPSTLSTLTESQNSSQKFTSLDVKDSERKEQQLISDNVRNSSEPKSKPSEPVNTVVLAKQYSPYNEKKLGSMAYRDTAVSRTGIMPGRESEAMSQSKEKEKETSQIEPIKEKSEKSENDEKNKKFQNFSLMVSESINPSTVSKSNKSKKSSGQASSSEYYSEYTEGGETTALTSKTSMTGTSASNSAGMPPLKEKRETETTGSSNLESGGQKTGKSSKKSKSGKLSSKKSGLSVKRSKSEMGISEQIVDAENDVTGEASKSSKKQRQKSLPSEDASQSRKNKTKTETGTSASNAQTNSDSAFQKVPTNLIGTDLTAEQQTEKSKSSKSGQKKSKRSKSKSRSSNDEDDYEYTYLTPDGTASKTASKSKSRKKSKKDSADASGSTSRKSKDSKNSKSQSQPLSESYSQAASKDDAIAQTTSNPSQEIVDKSSEEQNDSNQMNSFSTGTRSKSRSKKKKNKSRESRKSKSSRSSKSKQKAKTPEIAGTERFLMPVSSASERAPSQSSRGGSSLSPPKRSERSVARDKNDGSKKDGATGESSSYYYYSSESSLSGEEETNKRAPTTTVTNAGTGTGSTGSYYTYGTTSATSAPPPPVPPREPMKEASLSTEKDANENDDVKKSDRESSVEVDKTYDVETPKAPQRAPETISESTLEATTTTGNDLVEEPGDSLSRTVDRDSLEDSLATPNKTLNNDSQDVKKEDPKAIPAPVEKPEVKIATEDEEESDSVEKDPAIRTMASQGPQEGNEDVAEEEPKQEPNRLPPELPPRVPIEAKSKTSDESDAKAKKGGKHKSHKSGEKRSKKSKRSKSKASDADERDEDVVKSSATGTTDQINEEEQPEEKLTVDKLGRGRTEPWAARTESAPHAGSTRSSKGSIKGDVKTKSKHSSLNHPVSISHPTVTFGSNSVLSEERSSSRPRISEEYSRVRTGMPPNGSADAGTSLYATNASGHDVVPGKEISTESNTKRSTDKRKNKSVSDDTQYMRVGEQRESFQPSEVEEISNQNVKDDGVLRPILSQKGHKLKLKDQSSAEYTTTESGSSSSARTGSGSEYYSTLTGSQSQSRTSPSPRPKYLGADLDRSAHGKGSSVKHSSGVEPVEWRDGAPNTSYSKVTPTRAKSSRQEEYDKESFLIENKSRLASATVEPSATVVNPSAEATTTYDEDESAFATTTLTADDIPESAPTSLSTGDTKKYENTPGKEDSEYWSRKRLNVVPKDETPLVSGAKRSSEPSMGETSKSEGDTGGTGMGTGTERTSGTVTTKTVPTENTLEEEEEATLLSSKHKKGHKNKTKKRK